MFLDGGARGLRVFLTCVLLLFCSFPAFAAANWKGTVRDKAGLPVAGATVHLQSLGQEYSATTSASGEFLFAALQPGSYQLQVLHDGKIWTLAGPLDLKDAETLFSVLELSATDRTLLLLPVPSGASTPSTGGERLSSNEVSSLPLNERDFSKLLLLAAGTMTDTNGAANFTQQFSANGQRGVASVFAIDGADTTDPELGGATFQNFNVDAIQEVQSSSGVMPAEIGHGAAGFTNVVTKSGTDQVHGSAFEFLRNAVFDAKNFFDHQSAVDPRRIPPFIRNEFGVTNGGPVFLPGIYDGRGKTFYFGEYQGFRQVLGTTQVFPVPTADERKGTDTTTFPGDTLFVPVNPAIAGILARYPLPNEPTGPYGARTYAASSNVLTRTDQFSIRVDHTISGKATLFTRFSLNQVSGPTTNPDQTAIAPDFAVNFFDHQRSASVRYVRTISPRLSFASQFGYVRSTPIFPAANHSGPAIVFGDALYEGFNTADGSIFGSYGNVYQIKQDMNYSRGPHAFKWGVEIRLNKDATVFGFNPNGEYSFGGGTAYSPVLITSASGLHNVQPGAPLPDALTGLLTASPYAYTITARSNLIPGGDKFDEAAVRREAYDFYFQDAWKASSRLTINYGLRYEVNSRIKEAKHRTSVAEAVGPGGQPTSFLTPGATEILLYNPQPIYPLDWGGLGPRLAVDYAISKHTTLHAGGAITTILPNLWQDNFVTGAMPFTFQPAVTAQPSVAVAFSPNIIPLTLPQPYTTSGQLLFASGSSADVAPNTPVDLRRFQADLAALTSGNEVQLLVNSAIVRNFRNGYIGTYTAGLDQDLGSVKLSVAYVGTAGVHLATIFSPNGYTGAGPGFAPFTQFNAQGQPIGGFGSQLMMSNGSHSSYNALQTSATENHSRFGLSFQASYTYSKSLDDTSSVLGGLFGGSGTILQAQPQDPLNPKADKGPSTFDITHVFSLSLIQSLPFDRLAFLQQLTRKLTQGWQFLSVTSLMTGSPFSVYSGVQQTGFGAGGADRPDLVKMPDLSTGRAGDRQDYFGLGANNSSFFFLPIHVPGGSGPNGGRFGTLGRNTFRGPAFHQFDFAMIKDTPFGRRGKNELGTVEFRAEFFNVFNITNFGLPSNVVEGSGFGIISKTGGPSRQIQFSLKLMY
ncbi:MAG TPA: carboxypeptidase-like regulatory domain-containing protein [Candidatus Acidoferrum sp.]|nr:carboxypeptidase-like regulatory domain-containing protein [Candidatus Acidoferrum sp.]